MNISFNTKKILNQKTARKITEDILKNLDNQKPKNQKKFQKLEYQKIINRTIQKTKNFKKNYKKLQEIERTMNIKLLAIKLNNPTIVYSALMQSKNFYYIRNQPYNKKENEKAIKRKIRILIENIIKINNKKFIKIKLNLFDVSPYFTKVKNPKKIRTYQISPEKFYRYIKDINKRFHKIQTHHDKINFIEGLTSQEKQVFNNIHDIEKFNPINLSRWIPLPEEKEEK